MSRLWCRDSLIQHEGRKHLRQSLKSWLPRVIRNTLELLNPINMRNTLGQGNWPSDYPASHSPATGHENQILLWIMVLPQAFALLRDLCPPVFPEAKGYPWNRLCGSVRAQDPVHNGIIVTDIAGENLFVLLKLRIPHAMNWIYMRPQTRIAKIMEERNVNWESGRKIPVPEYDWKNGSSEEFLWNICQAFVIDWEKWRKLTIPTFTSKTLTPP